jgi:hypothetical protein
VEAIVFDEYRPPATQPLSGALPSELSDGEAELCPGDQADDAGPTETLLLAAGARRWVRGE